MTKFADRRDVTEQDTKTQAGQYLADAFYRIGQAAVAEYNDRQTDKAKSEAVRAKMPKRHPLDSYWTWAKLARQYSGAGLTDSGGIYGRSHSAPIASPNSDPINVSVRWYGGQQEIMATINLPHFLYHMLDAGHEDAMAVQAMIDWWSTWISPYPSWEDTLNDLFSNTETLAGFVVPHGPALRVNRKAMQIWVRRLLENGDIGFRPGQGIPEDEFESYARDAVKALKSKTLRRFVELEPYIDGAGYTYNYENSLNQDFAWWTIQTNEEPLLLVRTHNGCDARRGFSSPLAAGPKNYDVAANEVPFYVSVDVGAENLADEHSYFQAIARFDAARAWFGCADLERGMEKLRATLEIIDNMDSRQLALDTSVEPIWPYPFPIEIARQLAEILVPDEDGELPELPIVGEIMTDGAVRLIRPGEEADLPGQNVALLDPGTGNWTAGYWHEVYNY